MRGFLALATTLTLVALLVSARPGSAQDDGPAATVSAQVTRIADLEATIVFLQTQIAALLPTPVPRDPRCLDVPEETQQALLVPFQSEYTLRGAQAVKSETLDYYFIAGLLEGGDLQKGGIAVFAVISLDEPSAAYSINRTAQGIFYWPDGDQSAANLTMESDGANVAVKCTREVSGL